MDLHFRAKMAVNTEASIRVMPEMMFMTNPFLNCLSIKSEPDPNGAPASLIICITDYATPASQEG